MATYLKGMTDVVPQIQPYQPDFGFIQKALATRQHEFDKGFSAVKNTYNQVLNAPLSDLRNQQVRNQYIKTAEKQLADLSTKDLSLSENQRMAEQVFAPFWEDRFILEDAQTTKWYQSEMQKAFAARDSQDEKVRSQYNDVAVHYLQNGLEKLQQAGRDPANYARLDKRRFVPFKNLENYLNEQAKETGLKIEWNSANGPYLVSTTNGPQSVHSFETFAHNMLGNNFTEQFRVMGMVEKEERIRLLKKSFPALTDQQAIGLMANDYVKELNTGYDKRTSLLDTDLGKIKERIKEYEKLTGLSPAQETMYRDLLQKTDGFEQQLENLRDEKKKLSSDPSAVTHPLLSNPEGFFAGVMKQRTVNGWANARSAGQQVKTDINPVWKETNQINYQKAQLDIDRERLDIEKKEYELAKWKAENESEKDKDKESSGTSTKGGSSKKPNKALVHFDGTGATDVTKVGDPYQVFMGRQKQRWDMAHNEIFNLTHGAGRMLQTLGINDQDAVRYMDMMRTYSEDPGISGKYTVDDRRFFRQIGDKLKNYTGIDAASGFYNARTALLEAVRKEMTDKLKDGGAGVTKEDVEMLVSYSASTQALQEYTTLEEERKKIFTERIGTDKKYEPYLVKGKDGAVDFVGTKEITKMFSRPSYKFKDGTTFTREQLAQFYIEGRLEIPRNEGGHADITIDGKDYIQSPDVVDDRFFLKLFTTQYGPKATDEIAKIREKYGTSKDYLDLRQEANKSIVPNLAEYKNQTGKMGFVVRYDLNEKTQDDTGAHLINEAALASNRDAIYVDGKLSNEDDGLNNAIIALSSMREEELENYVSTTLLKTVGPTGQPSIAVRFKPMKESDKTNVSDFAVADLAGKEIEFVLKPNTSGETLRQIRINPGYYIYGALLRGKPMLGDPIMAAAGFNFEVTPDRRENPTGAIVKLDRKELVNGKYEPAATYREQFSFTDKSPDEIMNFLYQQFHQHLIINLAAQKATPTDTTTRLPTPAEVRAAYKEQSGIR